MLVDIIRCENFDWKREGGGGTDFIFGDFVSGWFRGHLISFWFDGVRG